MVRDILKGTGVALVTPFKADGAVDFESLKKLINFVIEGGVQYVVALGTTGETPTLSKEEKLAIVDTTFSTVSGRVPVVIGIGGNNTHEIIENFKFFDLSKADAVLSVSPYYSKPNQEGLFQHYKALDAAAPLPIIMYNVPSRTAMNVTGETQVRIANQCKNIFATKEASGDFAQINYIIKNKSK